MYNLVCKYCGVNFKHINQKTKFCSRKCYYDSRKGVKRPEHGEKIRKIMLAKNETYKGTKRAENISKARKKDELTMEQINKIIEGIRKYYYVKNPEILLKKIGLWEELRGGLKHDPIIELIKEHNTFFTKGSKECFPLYIQSMSRATIDGIIHDSQILPWPKILKKYNITKGNYKHLLKLHGIKNYVYKETSFGVQTKPEYITEEILKSLDVEYVRERYIKHKTYRCDFIIDNKYIIEVQGDYWHGNHRLFENSDLNWTQKNRQKKDKKKREFALNKGYFFIEIWEMDLYNRYNIVYTTIEKIIKKGEFNGTKYFSSEFF